MKEIICASVTEPSIDQMIKTSDSVDSDLVELRLDFLEDVKGIERLKKINKPVMATCMPKWEGGRFSGDEMKRIAILKDAAGFSKYVSIELGTEQALRDDVVSSVQGKGARAIVSYHDNRKTPEIKEMIHIIKKEKEAGADIGKISFFANDYGDVLRTMEALVGNKTGMPVIAISMGEIGKVSRILGPVMGSYMTFASPGKGKEAAPGQLTVAELKEIFRMLK